MQNEDKKTKEESIYYNSKPNKSKRKSKDKDSKDNRKSKKGKLYKNYKNPNVYYEPNNCFVTNKKLCYKWEEKTGKKFILYQLRKSESKKNKKRDYNNNKSLDDKDSY